MGIYIKGMEMPTSCVTDDCPCVNREMGFCQADPEGRYVYGDRPHWCPLIPVPDHGKLIDADALKDMMIDALNDALPECRTDRYRKIMRDTTMAFMQDIEECPVIIPADKEVEP